MVIEVTSYTKPTSEMVSLLNWEPGFPQRRGNVRELFPFLL
jgi:hypothetical protein